MKKYVIKLVLLPLMLCTTAACALDSDFFAAPPDDRPFYKRPKTYPRAREASEKLPVYSSIFTKIQVAFAPWNDVEGLIVKTINKAREEILVQAYVLSNQQLIAALLQAHERGVKVKVLVDRKQMQARDSRVLDLVSAGIPVGLEVR